MKRKIWSLMLATLLLAAFVVNVGAANEDPYSDFQYITVFRAMSGRVRLPLQTLLLHSLRGTSPTVTTHLQLMSIAQAVGLT